MESLAKQTYFSHMSPDNTITSDSSETMPFVSSDTVSDSSESTSSTNLCRPQRMKRKLSKVRNDSDPAYHAQLKTARRRKQNRIAAHISREKKKHYVTDLEARAKQLADENTQMQAQLRLLTEENKRLRSLVPLTPSTSITKIDTNSLLNDLHMHSPTSSVHTLPPITHFDSTLSISSDAHTPHTSSVSLSEQSPGTFSSSPQLTTISNSFKNVVALESAELIYSQQSKVTTPLKALPVEVLYVMMILLMRYSNLFKSNPLSTHSTLNCKSEIWNLVAFCRKTFHSNLSISHLMPILNLSVHRKPKFCSATARAA